ncbi:hypothetical protein [Thermomonospora cellulosilytica]|uniref:Uncharacterized protein n=1 Tax=Thermomonospora cellulosilytica TaxID=1411118 RepID=A0A7W3R7R9_9ACTN|nr:hypothetical protein [Thermomonospora cellulosilytica]MBA9002957.1 hypothetical protein [Thermomonospora cellulosilytica]
MKDEGHDRDMAERIIDQTLAFLAACTQNPGAKLAPSNIVDPGRHAFIPHTRGRTRSSVSAWPDGSSTTCRS